MISSMPSPAGLRRWLHALLLCGLLPALTLLSACGEDKRFSETKSVNISVQPTDMVYDPMPVGTQSVAQTFRIRQDGEMTLKVSDVYLKSAGFAEADRCDRVSLGISRNTALPADLADQCHFIIETRHDGSELPWELGTNREVHVTVAYNSLGSTPGAWSLVVESNALNTPSVEIPLRVRQESPVFGGDREVAFPITGGTKFASIRNIGTGSLQVSNYTVRYLTPVPVDAATQRPKEEFRVVPDRELPWQLDNITSQTLSIYYEPIDDEPDVAEIVFTSPNAVNGEYRIRLTSQPVQSVIVVEPNPAVFGPLGRGEREARREISISNRGLKSLDVTSLLVQQPKSDYQVDSASPTSFQLRPGDSQAIIITYTPHDDAGSDATLLITSNADVGADDQRLTHVSLVQSPDNLPAMIAVDPPVLQFDDVAEGGTATQSITLRNPGARTLQISRIAFSAAGDVEGLDSDPEFSLVQPINNMLIEPGESHELSVKFSRAAQDRRALAAVLLIESNADPATTRVYMSSAPPPQGN